MANVYKSIELVGSSSESFEAAVKAAVRRAGDTVRGLQWMEVMEQRGYLREGDIAEFQVKVRIWFELEEGDQVV
jgi:dodecin